MAATPQQATQTPLEQLMEMNERVGSLRKRKAKKVKPPDRVEAFYRRQLVSLLKLLNQKVKEELIPVLKQEQAFYKDHANERYIQVLGLHVFIEQWRGEVRKPEWPPLQHHYGYIRGVTGSDGDGLDVFLKNTMVSEHLPVFVVDQVDQDGEFDEHKVMLGFSSEEEARKGYLSNFTPDWRMGKIRKMSLSEFKEWMSEGDLSKPSIVKDTQFKDDWASRIISKMAKILSDFQEGVFVGQAERLARSTVSMAESATTEEFLNSVNRAVGVDMERVINQEGIKDYLDAAVQQNVSLIKSLPNKYFESIENIVLGGTRSGETASKIARDIEDQFDVSRRRAHLIARDQTAKLTSDINQKRQEQAGIKYYRVVTAGDRRVSGKPGGKYPNSEIKCWEIAKRDIGYGPGVYRWDKGASYAGKKGLHPGRHHINCRCTAAPVFEWELPKKKRK